MSRKPGDLPCRDLTDMFRAEGAWLYMYVFAYIIYTVFSSRISREVIFERGKT